MGQIFHACAYDIENRVRCVLDADKFHANCYSFSGAVFSMHYLLRQKPYRVMWGGGYVVLDDNIRDICKMEDLLGLSTYLSYDNFEWNNKDLVSKSYYESVKIIGDNNKLWKDIDVWDEAKKYFNWEITRSVKYDGYLLNHTQKLAVNLADYYERSKISDDKREVFAIDALPVLTETGGGTPMAFECGNGAYFLLTADSTEELVGEWCGDLLQITDEPPKDYRIINCCFADMWGRASYCYHTFGVDDNNLILKNTSGALFEGVGRHLRGLRSLHCNIKAMKDDNGIAYSTESVKNESETSCPRLLHPNGERKKFSDTRFYR